MNAGIPVICVLLLSIPILVMFIYGLINVIHVNQTADAFVTKNPEKCVVGSECELHVTFNADGKNYTVTKMCNTFCSYFIETNNTTTICYDIKDPTIISEGGCYKGDYHKGIIFLTVSSTLTFMLLVVAVICTIHKLRQRRQRTNQVSQMRIIPKEKPWTSKQEASIDSCDDLSKVVIGINDGNGSNIVIIQP